MSKASKDTNCELCGHKAHYGNRCRELPNPLPRPGSRRVVCDCPGPKGSSMEESRHNCAVSCGGIKSKPTEATLQVSTELPTELRGIAEDMMLAIREAEKYGPGALVEYQLGKIGRGNVDADPKLIIQAAAALEAKDAEIEHLRFLTSDLEACTDILTGQSDLAFPEPKTFRVKGFIVKVEPSND